MVSMEQLARDLLERCGHPTAQSLTAGDVVELANILNLLAESKREHKRDSYNTLDNCPMTWSEELSRRLCIVHVCDCGAADWNARVDAVLSGKTSTTSEDSSTSSNH